MFDRIAQFLSDPAALAGTCVGILAALALAGGLLVFVVVRASRPPRRR